MQVFPRYPTTWVRACSLFGAAGAAVLLANLALGAQQAPAQYVVAPRVDMVKQLADRHGQAPVAMGLANTGTMIEVFAADDGITWTIVVTMPNRMSWIVSSGRHWMQLAPTKTVKKVRQNEFPQPKPDPDGGRPRI